MAEEAELSLHTLAAWWPAPAYAEELASEDHEWEVSTPFPSAPLHRYMVAPEGSVLDVEDPGEAEDPEPSTEKYTAPTVVGADVEVVEVEVLDADVVGDVVKAEVVVEVEVEVDVVGDVVDVDVEDVDVVGTEVVDKVGEVVDVEVDEVEVDALVDVEADVEAVVEELDVELDVEVLLVEVLVDVEVVVATGLNTAADSA